jgi:2,4-dienoyl-CoA reductase-like NADH-dependent reductase (Old Yellow Enzyme family)/thioredoxin reductase
MATNVSRRSLVKGAGAMAAGTAAAVAFGALSGNEQGTALASEKATSDAAESAQDTVASSDISATTAHTWGDILNPQDTSEIGDSSGCSALFEPLQIAGKTMRNRFMKSAAGSETNEDPDWPDDFFLGFYGRIADGGAGMIAVESSNTLPTDDGEFNGSIPLDAPGSMKFLDLQSDDGIPAHAAIAERIHEGGSLVLGQMLDMQMTAGGAGENKYTTKMESSYNPGYMQSTDSVQREIGYFVDAAERYYKAGYDGVEINAACNHYFSCFLSRHDNNVRTDQYSGESIENRTRVICELIEGIRERVGDDFIVQVLYNPVEENVESLGQNDLCNNIYEGIEMAKYFESAGASSIHVRSHAFGHHAGGYMPDLFHMFEHGDTGYGSVMDFRQHYCGLMKGDREGMGGLVPVAEQIKKNVSIPVGVVGFNDPRIAPDYYNSLIADGKIDFVIMNRPFMVDPEYVNKLQEGRSDEILPCARCMTCFPSPFDFTVPMYCRVNAALTRSGKDIMPEGWEPSPASESKSVMVAGGGPAGMEAARIAAQRGYDVTLYELQDQLGGKMQMVQKLRGPHERIDDHRAFLERQMEVCGVNVVTGTSVDADLVAEKQPDIVIVANGGTTSGIESLGVTAGDGVVGMVKVMSDVLGDSGDIECGDSVVVIGGQYQACNIVVKLINQGVRKIYQLNPGTSDEWFKFATVWYQHLGEQWLPAHGVKTYHGVTISEVDGTSVTFTTDAGVEVTLDVDTVIDAMPMTNNMSLYDQLQGSASEVYAVGDARFAGNIAYAVAGANLVARKMGDGQIDESEFINEALMQGSTPTDEFGLDAQIASEGASEGESAAADMPAMSNAGDASATMDA